MLHFNKVMVAKKKIKVVEDFEFYSLIKPIDCWLFINCKQKLETYSSAEYKSLKNSRDKKQKMRFFHD